MIRNLFFKTNTQKHNVFIRCSFATERHFISWHWIAISLIKRLIIRLWNGSNHIIQHISNNTASFSWQFIYFNRAIIFTVWNKIFKKMAIQWAPWNVPMHRRLEVLTTGSAIFIAIGLGPLVCLVILYLLVSEYIKIIINKISDSTMNLFS